MRVDTRKNGWWIEPLSLVLYGANLHRYVDVDRYINGEFDFDPDTGFHAAEQRLSFWGIGPELKYREQLTFTFYFSFSGMMEVESVLWVSSGMGSYPSGREKVMQFHSGVINLTSGSTGNMFQLKETANLMRRTLDRHSTRWGRGDEEW